MRRRMHSSASWSAPRTRTGSSVPVTSTPTLPSETTEQAASRRWCGEPTGPAERTFRCPRTCHDPSVLASRRCFLHLRLASDALATLHVEMAELAPTPRLKRPELSGGWLACLPTP